MGDLTESPNPQPPPTLTPPSRPVPFREDCWSEEATTTLVESWGRRFLELNRGNLRQKDWQEVADAVNARHGHTKKTRRTDVQCKNRIDTLKKKYKTEKAKIAESNETLTSSWPFYSRLDFLIGSSYHKNQAKPTPSMAVPLMIMAPPPPAASSSVQIQSTMPFSLPSPPMAVPLPYRKPMIPAMMPTKSSAAYNSMVMPQKRPSPSPGPEESFFRRNYSAVAAAAAAMNDDDEASDEDDEYNVVDEERVNVSGEDEEDEGVGGEEIGLKRLAKAIESFAEIYEKVEGMKQRQMIELEKQRIQFAKDLEVQRMQLFMDTQVQLEKMKRLKRSGSSDGNNES